VPIAGATVGAGVAGYANYQFEGTVLLRIIIISPYMNNRPNCSKELRKTTTRWLHKAQDSAAEFASTASGTFSSISNSIASTAQSVELPNVEVPQILKDLYAQPTRKSNRNRKISRREQDESGEGKRGQTPEDAAAVAALVAATMSAPSDSSEEGRSTGERASDSGNLMHLTRRLIEIRSVLLSIDQSDSLKLPSIVVVGSQSSGKSSVLEAIVGHQFLPKFVQVFSASVRSGLIAFFVG